MAPMVNLASVYGVYRERIHSGDSDTCHLPPLARQGEDAFPKKIGEECSEALLTARERNRNAAIHEAAGARFHYLIRTSFADSPPEDVVGEPGLRFDRPGLNDRRSR